MYRPPRGHPALAERKVLLIDRFRETREARTAVLRTHAVEVHEQRIVFLPGPPKYLSRTWSGEIAKGDTSRGRLSETVKGFLAAA
jgi:hypothetical protein